MTLQTLIIANCILIGENIVNVYIDAYKIKIGLQKNIANNIKHGINFMAYGIVTGLCIWLFHMPLWIAIVYGCSALFNRQITFDIPLNWRRGLSWDYVSPAKPPAAFMDKIEVAIFGYNGKAPTICYGVIWIGTLITQYFTL